MKKFIFFFVLFFNFSFDVFASNGTFDGTYSGSESGSYSGSESGSYSGSEYGDTSSTDKGTTSSTDKGTTSGSGSGSITNSGSVSNYMVFIKCGLTPSIATGDSNSSNFTFSTLGNQYYFSSTTAMKNVSSISGVSSSTFYVCYYKPTGARFYTFANNINSDCYEPYIISLGNGTSDFTFSESGSYSGSSTGSYSGSSSGSYTGSSKGSYSGTEKGTTSSSGSGTVAGDIAIDVEKALYLEYPPAFPSSSGSGGSYSETSDVYVKSFTASSSGMTIDKDFMYGIVTVNYVVEFSEGLPLGSYLLAFPLFGSDSITGSYPDSLFANSTYATSVSSNYYTSVTGFDHVRYGNNYPILHVYFDMLSNSPRIAFSVNYFVMSNVPSFTFSLTNNSALNHLFVADSNLILDEIQAFKHNEYPPSFPVDSGLSYSAVSDVYVTGVHIYSSGITIPDGYTSALLPVTFSFSLSGRLGRGSFFLDYSNIGSDDRTGSLPDILDAGSTYVSRIHNNYQHTITSFNYTLFQSNYPSVHLSFTNAYPGSANNVSFIAYFYVREDVSSFDFNMTNQTTYNFLMIADDNAILDVLSNAHGDTSGLDSQNSAMDKALSDYQKDTDTSKQYGNIPESLFTLDTSIFVQVSSTISLFSSVVTGLFTAFGDLSVPLTMFLIVTVVSCIIGIIKVSSDSS